MVLREEDMLAATAGSGGFEDGARKEGILVRGYAETLYCMRSCNRILRFSKIEKI
mgnify:CR=1 FL=1